MNQGKLLPCGGVTGRRKKWKKKNGGDRPWEQGEEEEDGEMRGKKESRGGISGRLCRK